MAARVFGPRPQELEATRPRVRARFNNPWNVERSCSGDGGSATILPRLAPHPPQKIPAAHTPHTGQNFNHGVALGDRDGAVPHDERVRVQEAAELVASDVFNAAQPAKERSKQATSAWVLRPPRGMRLRPT